MTNKSNTLDDVHIGQTIFIVLHDSLKIIPAIIAEKTHIETLTESSVVWKVMVGPEEKRKVYPLDKISGDKFATLEEARAELLRSFHESLQDEIEDTITKAMSWYKIPKNQISIDKVVVKPQRLEEKAEPEDDEDDIFDPTDLLASSNVQTEKATKPKPKRQKPEPETSSTPLVNFNEATHQPTAKKATKKSSSQPKPTTAKEALRAALEGGEDDDDFVEYGGDSTSLDGEANVIMPDGERIRVKL